MAHESSLSLRFTHGDLRLLSEAPLPEGFIFDSITVSRTVARFFNFFGLVNAVRAYFVFEAFAPIDGVEIDSSFVAYLRGMLAEDWSPNSCYTTVEQEQLANELRAEDRRGNVQQLRAVLDELEPWLTVPGVTVIFEAQGS